MKLNKVAMAVALTAALGSVSALAAGDTTTGEIQLQGELVTTPCGLAPESSPVTVDFGQLPIHALADNARAGNVQKNIVLQYCDPTVASSAVVTYTPTSIDPANDALAAFTSGTATGAGIGLRDSGNQDVVWGQETTPVQIVKDQTTIPFVAYVQADSASATPTAGTFQSTINFSIAYQ
ncbi:MULTISPECIES: fimbrial protein [Tenebrionibacter/Tenebrionicola group]|jgi:major type 1 subunit fimbrin (pilin)|uniref:Type 1 fimbrial protein n=2 Tax=Tenebrionibacter/Tenebrionicola group TaxID=2969848 RepID=A0A8K0XZ09_9ENTR|nr:MULTISPECIES: fimbrial protein [Tenebrionibacter/Tenebrionicola group]MBK4715099.1 type 1 fimbrial protein [Tenebrionibacter intestinalis]MBV4414027.1 type 1 fimbrial protein [Tenebrionicola larvae]MBV5096241.1 type 1 fimbrial protein [Tenebrionicola larvae]